MDSREPSRETVEVPAGYRSQLGPVVVSEEAIQRRVRELGAEITRDYDGRELTLIGVLKGAFIFMADLSRQIHLPLRFDFMAVSSYGSATKTSGVVRILKDLDREIDGQDVILVEDIIDSGLTLNYLLRYLRARGPASLEVCSLFIKDVPRTVSIPVTYEGFRIPGDFVVGYGLDYAERFRNLGFVGLLRDPPSP